MANTMTRIIAKPRLSIKTQTLAAITAIAGAVAIPQIFHVFGTITGLGTLPGEVFLPMHLPILLVGLLAGLYAGIIAGMFGPVASYVLCGMPRITMLPFMIFELGAYGLFSGLLRNVKLPVIAKVFAAQMGGRVIRAAAILIAVYVFGNQAVPVAVIWTSIRTGIWGIVLQWALIPLIVYLVEKQVKYEG